MIIAPSSERSYISTCVREGREGGGGGWGEGVGRGGVRERNLHYGENGLLHPASSHEPPPCVLWSCCAERALGLLNGARY